jgi:hypothetical protein
MKKLYTITMMLVMSLTTNLFSQTLPYNVGVNGQDGDISVANGWTFKFEIGTPLTDFTSTQVLENTNGSVRFSQPASGEQYLGSAIKEITSMGTITNLDYLVNWSYPINGGATFKLYGSVDGIDWSFISNISNNTTSSFINSNNYTWVKVEFNGTGDMIVELNNFDLYDMTTGIESNISDNLNVYSYDKNLVVKSNYLEEYNLTVYNINGQVILNKTTRGNNNFKLDVSNGMYLVNINNGTESINQKVVIQ